VRRLLRTLLVVALVVFVVFAAAGWYFSEELRRDALETTPSPDDPKVEVVGMDEGRITLAQGDPEDKELTAPGTFGLSWDGGYGRVTGVLERQGDEVVRRFTEFERGRPETGTLTDVDPTTFPGNPMRAFGMPYEEVTYETPLGPMDAWLVSGTGRTWLVMVHGKGASRSEGMRMLSATDDLNWPTLMITYRNDPGQPPDPSGWYRYGETEWQDLEGAVRFAIDEGAERVVLVGLSTGAAISLSFLYESDLADRVVGTVFDAPNIDFLQTIEYGASQRNLPIPFIDIGLPDSLTAVATWISAWRFDLDWQALDYVARADELEVPILVFHGEADTTVPVEESQELAEARPDLVRLVVVERAGHVQSWNATPQRYGDVVSRFLGGLRRG
jgi:pimeloyl-ACP methyl ester carboxylesterase